VFCNNDDDYEKRMSSLTLSLVLVLVLVLVLIALVLWLFSRLWHARGAGESYFYQTLRIHSFTHFVPFFTLLESVKKTEEHSQTKRFVLNRSTSRWQADVFVDMQGMADCQAGWLAGRLTPGLTDRHSRCQADRQADPTAQAHTQAKAARK